MTKVIGPHLRVLGIAQDGGVPHAACDCRRCASARQDPRLASGPACLALVGSQGQAWLIDATPAITEQLAMLADLPRQSSGELNRRPLEGLLLTHAHIGHYLGLALLGYEAANVQALPVWASQRMASFLRDNAPWDQLVTKGNIALQLASPGTSIQLSPSLVIEPFEVPHRAEYTDTLGYVIQGPRRRVLYIPDISPWEQWEEAIAAVASTVDLALLDGTFYSADELPGRDISALGHPLIPDTMERLQALVDAGDVEVAFIHLNHTNPALEPGSVAHQTMIGRGFRLAKVGEQIAL